MKFIVPSQLLYKNLQTVSGIITGNISMPVAEHVLFVIEGKKLHLTATDLETTITTQLELSDSEVDGKIVIPAKIVMETLKSLPDVPVIFSIGADYAVELSADESNYKLVGYNADEFPQKPVMENASSFEINGNILGEAIGKTIFAIGSADIRPVMAGVFCDIKPEGVAFVATDAHRLSKYTYTELKTGMDATFIMPKKPLMTLKNILQAYDGLVRVDFNDSKVAFQFETISIISKLIEGKYPNYTAVIPKSNTNILKVERLPLLQRMRSISPYANQSTHQVRLKIEPASMRLMAEDLDTTYKATATVPCTFEYEGGEEPFEIGFSSKFLQEILTTLDSDEVLIKLSNPNAAGLVFPLENGEPDENILMLIMPVMLGS
ncbi:MAG: DNA polymerase III subunit beta [Bacteroidales bacterium]|jgi:DNA polymerase-3 subunit beta|nr:DNA polymerase III subunit beta [Bacteroidales bacterium]